MAVGRDLQGDDYKVVAVIGDGSMGSGLAYEGLNNAGASERDFIVVLNDNEMSIAPNVARCTNISPRCSATDLQPHPFGHRRHCRPRPRRAERRRKILRKWEESVKTFLTPACSLKN